MSRPCSNGSVSEGAMNLSLALAPVLPLPLLVVFGAVALALAVWGIATGLRGGWLRLAAVAALLIALLDPIVSREDREPLPSVVALVTDKSQSQDLGNRTAETEAARAALAKSLAGLPNVELREVAAGDHRDGLQADGTRLFEAAAQALSDVPPDRIAGLIMLTDGEVHDVPKDVGALGFNAPVHALISGRPDEIDRRVAVTLAPRFGLVGQKQKISFRVIDDGAPDPAGRARVAIRRDGEPIGETTVRPGETATIDVEIAHAGDNIVEIEVAPRAGELTEVNNRATVTIEGIHEHLRVLLVSGEPHAGERTWRNLLKSDASVDLVHFTILRPPEKQDGTPINELSLIAFPTRELFQEKISDFDLIIFDRYQRRGILPAIYFDNIARYVRDGGAVLVASGPDFSGQGSLFRTPLASVLPADPTGNVVEEGFLPRVSDLGRRHPVTRDLPGAGEAPANVAAGAPGAAGTDPTWSRWYRMVEVTPSGGTPVMEGPGGKPLLLLSREGKGRVGLFLSDHVWLWARGFEGGGPHGVLLRRLAHWLMKEPDLDEEALRLSARGTDLTIERQTLGKEVKPVEVTRPTGAKSTVTLKEERPGLWRATIPGRELGLWRVTDGERTALASVGPANPRELTEVVSTEKLLQPIATATGGSVRRFVKDGATALPRVLPLRAGVPMAGSDWIGLKMSEASVLKGVDRLPLFAGFLGLAVLLGLVSAMWWREGR